MNHAKAVKLQKEFDQLMAEFSKKHGLINSACTYTWNDTISFKVTLSPLDESLDEDVRVIAGTYLDEGQSFKKRALHFGMHESDLYKQFGLSGRTFMLIGSKTRGDKLLMIEMINDIPQNTVYSINYLDVKSILKG